jgi:hypothetical protein
VCDKWCLNDAEQLNNLYEEGEERKTMIDKEIRAILGRLINAGTLRNPVNGFELRETARHYKHGEKILIALNLLCSY